MTTAQDADNPTKSLDAVQRAVPVTRMVDYGVPLGDALRAHQPTRDVQMTTWDTTCETMAQAHVNTASEAEQKGHLLTAGLAWRSAGALFQCAQLAFNEDNVRKRDLYERSHVAYLALARCAGGFEPWVVPSEGTDLYGWYLAPASGKPKSVVLVLGGLSGWGAAYLDMAKALALRGMGVVLAEGPGQGLTRMRSALCASANVLHRLSAFFDKAALMGAQRFGIWGNSFGGLFAAHVATKDHRVSAFCTNGAPMAPTWPGYRTPREQMQAAFGTTGEVETSEVLKGLALSPSQHLMAADVLVVQGGQDNLVPLGSQQAFFGLAPSRGHQVFTWTDGEHTIYNHAAERNAKVSDWFATHLANR